jgi:hypothetical protein
MAEYTRSAKINDAHLWSNGFLPSPFFCPGLCCFSAIATGEHGDFSVHPAFVRPKKAQNEEKQRKTQRQNKNRFANSAFSAMFAVL